MWTITILGGFTMSNFEEQIKDIIEADELTSVMIL
jgi:hypothetical protein